jgi:hypothetical protein
MPAWVTVIATSLAEPMVSGCGDFDRGGARQLVERCLPWRASGVDRAEITHGRGRPPAPRGDLRPAQRRAPDAIKFAAELDGPPNRLRRDSHSRIGDGVRRDQVKFDDVDDAGMGHGHRDRPGRADRERLHLAILASGELLADRVRENPLAGGELGDDVAGGAQQLRQRAIGERLHPKFDIAGDAR